MSYICFGSFIFFSAAYTLFIYSYSQHGSIYSGLYSCSLGYVPELLLLFLHWFPLNLVILKVDVTVLLDLVYLNNLSKKYWFVVPMIEVLF
jgi:NADH-ubiquinone oxidoreductase chain 4